MRTETEADKNLAQTKTHLNAAIVLLGKIVVDQCEGYADFQYGYRLAMKNALAELLDARETLYG